MGILWVLLQMAGATMLLLYSVRMVRTGMERASGPALRQAIANPSRGRFATSMVGTLVAMLLQSSTATAMLASGFALGGLLTLSSGLALLLGADLGTALVVQFLSLDLKFLVPVLLLLGGGLFLNALTRDIKQYGRICLGIAFILIALQMISEATAPLKQAEFMPGIMGYFSSDFVSAFLVGAVVTFVFHSSVAAVLMIAAFAAQGVLPVDAGLSLILGANVGGGFIAVWLTRAMETAARRPALGNLLFRIIGGVTVLAIIQLIEFPIDWLGPAPERHVVNFHLLFNALLLVACLPFVEPMQKLLMRALPDKPDAEHGPETVSLHPRSALDRTVMDIPSLALASATRELLRMSGLIEVMIHPVMEFFANDDREQLEIIRKLDSQVNSAHTDIKLYIAEVNRGELSAEEAERSYELASFAINLERAGDVIAKGLLPLALKKHKTKLRFSDDGWQELNNLHTQVVANMQLALNVMVSEDIASARQLIVEKDRMRKLERESHDRHLERLKTGEAVSIESSDMHLETVRSLKELNSLFASVAVSILSRHGQLRDTRLKKSRGTS